MRTNGYEEYHCEKDSAAESMSCGRTNGNVMSCGYRLIRLYHKCLNRRRRSDRSVWSDMLAEDRESNFRLISSHEMRTIRLSKYINNDKINTLSCRLLHFLSPYLFSLISISDHFSTRPSSTYFQWIIAQIQNLHEMRVAERFGLDDSNGIGNQRDPMDPFDVTESVGCQLG